MSILKRFSSFLAAGRTQEQAPKQSSRRLIIHAGAHKTASTTLQIALFRNRDLLAAQNIHYPLRGEERAHHSLVSEWNPSLAKHKPDVPYTTVWEEINGICEGSPTTVILSSEEFSRRLPKTVDFKEIIKRTPSFDHHEVVVVLREQVSFLESAYLQMRRSNAHVSFHDWLESAVLTQDPKFGLYTDFSQLDDDLCQDFDEACVTYISYQTIGDHAAGPLGRFLSHIDVKPNQDLNLPGRMHRSLDPLGFVIAREVLNGEMPSNDQVAEAKALLLARHSGKTKTSIHTRDSLGAVRRRFQGLNDAFKQKVSERLSGEIILAKEDANTLYYDAVDQADRDAIKDALGVSTQ